MMSVTPQAIWYFGRVAASLFADCLVCQNGGITHLASGCRNRQNRSHRERFCQRYFFRPDIPECLLRICSSVCNGFCGVNRASAADGKNKVCLHFHCFFHTLLGKSKSRVWFYAAKLFKGKALFCKRCFHSVQKTAPFCTSASVNDEHLCAAPFLYLSACLVFGLFSEHDFRRGILYKLIHLLISSLHFYSS